MSRRWIYSGFTALLFALASLSAGAQGNGTYSGFSPYSVYGVGDLHTPGTAWNAGMGGVGIAARSKRFVNILNPASVTSRDSLSFMADFGLSGRLSVFSQEDVRTVNPLFNINDFVISFPMWRHTAFRVGITPFSDMGFLMDYSDIDGVTGKRTYTSAGSGSVYQFFAGAGITLWDRLSLGADYILLFGNLNKESQVVFNDGSYRNHILGDTLQVRASTVKFGLQYEQPINKSVVLTAGATYRLKARMAGNAIYYSNIQEVPRETKDLKADEKVYFGDELGAGLSLRKGDDWLVELDYTRSNWSGSGFDTVRGFLNNGSYPFTSSVAQSIRGGFEFTPNRNDIRYYLKRCTYRGGIWADQSYYKVDGSPIYAAGITLGMTLPVFRGYNGVTIGLEAGRRGLGNALVKENFFGFNVSFNIFDIWFQKPRYQ
jgi:hypothetical protein